MIKKKFLFHSAWLRMAGSAVRFPSLTLFADTRRRSLRAPFSPSAIEMRYSQNELFLECKQKREIHSHWAATQQAKLASTSERLGARSLIPFYRAKALFTILLMQISIIWSASSLSPLSWYILESSSLQIESISSIFPVYYHSAWKHDHPHYKEWRLWSWPSSPTTPGEYFPKKSEDLSPRECLSASASCIISRINWITFESVDELFTK